MVLGALGALIITQGTLVASITKRETKKGVVYKSEVRKGSGGKMYRESKTESICWGYYAIFGDLIRDSLELLDDLQLEEDVKELFLFRNAERVFNL